MNHEAPHYDEHPERSQNEWQSLMANGVVDTDFKPTEEYLTSDQGQQEVEAQNKAHDQIEMVDRLIANAKEQAENGRYTNVEFERLKKKYEAKKEAYQKEADEQSEAAMQDFSETFLDRNSIATPEEQARYQEWLQKRDAENMQNLKSRGATYQLVGDEATNTPTGEPEQGQENEKTRAQLEIEIDLVTEAAKRNELESKIDKLAEAANGDETESNPADTTKTSQETEADQAERLKTLEGELSKLRTDLAELFIKRNRIFGPKHWEEYDDTKEKYEATLDEYLRLKSHSNEEFLENYIDEDSKLLEDVNDRLDKGNLYRKIVNTIFRGQKFYKEALLNRGVESLGVTGAKNAAPFEPETLSETSTMTPEPTPAESAPKPEPETPPEASETPEEASAESPAEESPEEEAPVETPSAQAEANPEPPTEQMQDLDGHYKYLVNSRFNWIINPEGIDIMTSLSPDNDADRAALIQRIANWWPTLSEDAKNIVRTYERTQEGSQYGEYLRSWIAQVDRAEAAAAANAETSEAVLETT